MNFHDLADVYCLFLPAPGVTVVIINFYAELDGMSHKRVLQEFE